MSHQLVDEIHREAARRVRSFENPAAPSERFLAALRRPDIHLPQATARRRGTPRRMPRHYV